MSEVAELGAPPPDSRKAINKMADAFRGKLKESMPTNTESVPKPTQIAPATPPPPAPASNGEVPPPAPAPAAQPPKPATPPAAPTEPKNSKDWKALHEVKDQAVAEAKALKAERDTLKQQMDASKAELDTLRKGTSEYERVKSEHEASRKELATLQGIVDRVALEHTPKFQEHFTNRIKAFSAGLGALVTGDALTKAQQLLELPPSQVRKEGVKALIAELHAADDHVAAMALTNAFQNINLVEGERSAELARASENMSQWKAAQAKREQDDFAELQNQRKVLIEAANQRIDPELAGAEPETAKHLKEQARRFISGEIDRDNLLDVITHAAKGRKYDADTTALKAEVEKLRTQVAELTSATPPANGTGGGHRISAPTGDPMAQSGQAAGKKFREELAKRQGQR